MSKAYVNVHASGRSVTLEVKGENTYQSTSVKLSPDAASALALALTAVADDLSTAS